MITETDKLVITLEVTPEVASIDIALTPTLSSRFAEFVAAQRPSDYALFDRLPKGQSALIGGHLEAGPYHGGWRDAFIGAHGMTAEKNLEVAMDDLLKIVTGEFAFSTSITLRTGIAFSMLFGVSNAKSADRAIGSIVALFQNSRMGNVMGITMEAKADRSTTIHDGIELRNFDVANDISKMLPLLQRSTTTRNALEAMMPRQTSARIAMFDGLGMYVEATDSVAVATRIIDAARGKTAHFVAPALASRQLAAARARKDSVVAMVDFDAIFATLTGRSMSSEQIVMMSFGCWDHNAHIRIALPASLLHRLSTH